MTEASPDPDLSGLLLPPDVRLLHLGPHKTGTTAIQHAFHQSREALHAQHVHYGHDAPQAYLPALGLTGRRGRLGGPTASPEDWRDLLHELEQYDDYRCVVSSESFANADTEAIQRLRHDLGPDRVHVLRMARRYDGLLASQWQQSVAAGATTAGFEAWLRGVLASDDHGFWRRHHYAGLTRRWLEIVGTERLSVVVVDETDRTWLLRVMEALTGLRPGTLPQPRSSNDSLSLQETRALVLVNRLMERRGWVPQAHYQYLRLGARSGLRSVEPDAAARKIRLPDWARAEVRDRSLRHLDELPGLGVRVVGDPDLLVVPAAGAVDGPAVAAYADSVPVHSVVGAVAGISDRAEQGAFPIWTGERPPQLGRRRAGTGSAAGQAFLDELREHARIHGWTDERAERYLTALAPLALREPDHDAPEGRLPIAQMARLIAAAVEATDGL